ncbi:Deubiquitinase DESI2 [Geodia barretti]|uniref:Deubiquitinase DESI2 n=1 Tax=Geodia barretti TaxID=519541 RepID=A0AA35TJT6_GEOBA|nr:Deubiquitinase DESI2 [Geodia barretti]
MSAKPTAIPLKKGNGENLEDFMRTVADEFEAREQRMSQCPDVYLNVYDMLAVNTYVYPVGLGAYHTGVEVYGREYAYGCHPYSYSGIYDMEPRQADEITGQQVRFREAILIGHTHFSSEEVKGLVVLLGRDYNGCDYTILHRNCNHFSSDFCQRLCGATPPRWINRLAQIASWMPFVLNCLPPQLLSSPSHSHLSPTDVPALVSFCRQKK